MNKMYPKKWDRNRSHHFQIGIICALLFAYSMINLEIKAPVYEPFHIETLEDDAPKIIRTFREPPKNQRVIPPKPPKPSDIIEEIKDLEFVEKIEPVVKQEEVDVVSDDDFDDTTVEPVSEKAAAPIVEPAIDIPDEKPFEFIVEEMPVFGDCWSTIENSDVYACSNKSIIQFFAENVKYPRQARDMNVKGMVVAEFVINKDGSITDAKILRGLGFGCDEEVLRVIKNMPDWRPGKQNKRPVNVLIRVPVKFQLN